MAPIVKTEPLADICRNRLRAAEDIQEVKSQEAEVRSQMSADSPTAPSTTMTDVTLPHHGLVKAIVLADSGFQDDSRVILKEILQSFAECDEFVISLDPVRSIVDTIPAVAAHTPSEGATFGESLQRYGKNPKCWRLLPYLLQWMRARCSGTRRAWSGGVWNYLKLRPRAIVVRLSVLQEVYDET